MIGLYISRSSPGHSVSDILLREISPPLKVYQTRCIFQPSNMVTNTYMTPHTPHESLPDTDTLSSPTWVRQSFFLPDLLYRAFEIDRRRLAAFASAVIFRRPRRGVVVAIQFLFLGNAYF